MKPVRLVGMRYRKGAELALALLSDGVEVDLQREPDNQHDRNAIAVYVSGDAFSAGAWARMLANGAVEDTRFMLGYVSGRDAADLAPTMDRLGRTEVVGTLSTSGDPIIEPDLRS